MNSSSVRGERGPAARREPLDLALEHLARRDRRPASPAVVSTSHRTTAVASCQGTRRSVDEVGPEARGRRSRRSHDESAKPPTVAMSTSEARR